MDTTAIFNLQSALSLLLFGIIAKWYVWPRLIQMDYKEALIPLLLYSAFRYMGTFFMVPSMTNGLDPAWSGPAAYLDLGSVAIALVAAFLLRYRIGFGVPVAWLYGTFGAFAFVHGATQLDAMQVATHIGPAMPVMTILGSSWMVTIVVLFFVLVKHPRKSV